ncbi:MAG TPA: penicillin-binding protein 2 [Candidatus Saccharimonadales bacterium]|jgi:cell division protein FtsI/penicillin-binding protein 2|nr:penicillin-binding protein 2 [Candidatus Saccharimonadales bacterium]
MHLSLNRTGRARLLLLGLLVIGAIFIVRLFWLQVIQYNYYVAEANKEHQAIFTLTADRGKIYAKDGPDSTVPLVLNEPVYLAYVDPQAATDKNKIKDVMRQIAGGNVLNYSSQLDSKELRYVVMARNLSKQQAELIKKQNLAGVGLTQSERRVYPEGTLASQLLGYVDTNGKGQYGLEGFLNSQLAGKNGQLKTVTDVRQIPLTISGEDVDTPAVQGQDTVLNIDRNIQAHVEQVLKDGLASAKAVHGSAMVIDPSNGHVMAMANLPTYDPAKYSDISDYDLFQNKTVSDPYEAGSVIKTLTMGTGLDTGVVNRDSTYNNTGKVQVDDTIIRNVEEDPINPHATMTDILHYSLNTGVVYVLEQMGGGKVNLAARNVLYGYDTDHFQFGKRTGIEQQGEPAGTIIPPTDVQGNNVRYSNMAFGQGMLTSMTQVTSAFSAAINGGTYYQPQLVEGQLLPDGTIKQKAPQIVKQGVLKPATSATLRGMIVEARQIGVLGGKDKAGYIVGGKTGTSQIIDPKTGKYTNDNSIGSYLGFGGGKTPRYVIMIRVMDSKLAGYAGTVAAGPMFTDISNWLLDYLKVQPNN